MKATFDLPEELLRRTKATAALQGRTLKDYVAEAVREKLASEAQGPTGWRSVFGLARPTEVAEVDAIVEAEFERVDPETWR